MKRWPSGRGERAVHISGDGVSAAEATTGELIVLPPKLPRDLTTPICDRLKATPDIHNDGVEPCPEASTIRLQRGADCTLTGKDARGSIPSSGETCLR
jgi:hypothetical protein